jgi:hypothetical protein
MFTIVSVRGSPLSKMTAHLKTTRVELKFYLSTRYLILTP